MSPPIDRMVTVVAGDTLPALCKQIYGDSRFYVQVAKYNKLNKFRSLTPGTQLLFPPLSGSAS